MKLIHLLAISVLTATVSDLASAQAIQWSQRVRGEETSPGIYQSYAPDTSPETTRPLMGWSAAGTPGVVVAGALPSGFSRPNGLLVKISALDGSELWRSSLTQCCGTVIRQLHVDSAGNIINAGYGFMVGTMAFYYFWDVQKYSGATGAKLWAIRKGSPTGAATYNAAIEAITTDAAGNILAIGSTPGPVGVPPDTPIYAYVTKLASETGETLWTTRIPKYLEPHVALLAADADGGTFASPQAAVVVRVQFDGSLAWETDLLQNPDFACAAIRAMKVDPSSGDAIIAGRWNCNGPDRGFVARLDKTTGAVVWKANDVGGNVSVVSTLAVSGNHTIFAAGGHTIGTNPQRWFAARLSLTNGAVAWTNTGLADSINAVTDVATTPDGQLVLTGVCESNAFCAARLSNADGAVQWTQRTGDPYVTIDRNFPNTVLAAHDAVYIGGKDTADAATTWTVHRLANELGDAIFSNGME